MLLVCGSLHPKSANQAALDVVRTFLTDDRHALVDQFSDLADVPAFDPTSDEEAGAVTRLRRMIAESHAIIFAVPEYAGGMAGALKNALDFMVGSGELYERPSMAISAGTTGGNHALEQLVRTLAWQGAQVVASVSISSPRTKIDQRGVFTDAPTIVALQAAVRTVVAAGSMSPQERRALALAVLDRHGVERRDT